MTEQTMTYRIIELTLSAGKSEVRVQCKGWWRWHTVWKQPFSAADREYALLCAEEIKEHLEEGI